MPSVPAGLRVATYNIHRAVGTDFRRDPARVAAVIQEIDADVIGLQEVDWHHDSTNEESPVEYLSHLTGYRTVLGANIRDHRGHYGNLLLTRAPVLRVRQVDLSESRREPRGAIDVDLDVRGSRLRIIVTHLGLGLGERSRQAKRLRDVLLDQPDQATVLLGDFNDWLPGRPTLRSLRGLCGATACPASYPSFWPILALDRIQAYAFPSPLSVQTHVSRIARRASDHLPIVADIETDALIRRDRPHRRAPADDGTGVSRVLTDLAARCVRAARPLVSDRGSPGRALCPIPTGRWRKPA